jgi:splicing factor, arginine/serine-rich 17
LFSCEFSFLRYVQFSEYGSFVKCLDEFRGMKLVRKEADKVLAVNIKVTFDKTKHLSENCIKRRKIIRDRLIEKDREKVEEEERKLREEREKREKEKEKLEEMKKAQIIKQRQREERRKQKYIQKITQDESSELTKKIRHEQKKLLKAQRKVESIRLLEALFQRISAKYCIDDLPGPSKGFKGFDLRSKLKSKTSSNDKKSRERSLSISSVSSIESDKKKKKRKDSSSSSSSSEESEDEKKKKPISNGNYPGWCQHPETGEWIPTPNYVYPTPFFAASVTRPYYNPHFRGGYRGRGNYKGRGR